MTDVKNVTIELPCEGYPIKVIGDAGEGFARMGGRGIVAWVC